jgi:hypothetical protein
VCVCYRVCKGVCEGVLRPFSLSLVSPGPGPGGSEGRSHTMVTTHTSDILPHFNTST